MTRAEFFTCSRCGKTVEDKTLANMASLGLPCLCGATATSFRQSEEAGEYITWHEISQAAEHSLAIIGTSGEPLICKCGCLWFRISGNALECTESNCGRRYTEEINWVERSGWSK